MVTYNGYYDWKLDLLVSHITNAKMTVRMFLTVFPIEEDYLKLRGTTVRLPIWEFIQSENIGMIIDLLDMFLAVL